MIKNSKQYQPPEQLYKEINIATQNETEEQIQDKKKKNKQAEENEDDDDNEQYEEINENDKYDIKKALHPIAVIFTFIFKAAAVAIYFFGGIILSDIMIFILIVLLDSFDFWTVKNVTGRLLVGLRWWSDFNEEGVEEWRFESFNKKYEANLVDKSFFWTSQFAITGILTAIGFLLSSINLYCFYKCSKGEQKSELGLDSAEFSLIGEYKFDDQYGIDSSLMKNDIINVPKVGPQQGGKGFSAFFDQQNTQSITSIKHIEEYNSEDFSLSFWIYLIQDNNTPGWKTIIHKGSNPQELTPSIMLWPNSRRLHIRVSTDNNWNEDFDSNGLLPLRRWSQLVLTLSTQLVQLYINGILDNQLILRGQLRNNNGDFHIGMDEWHSGPIFYMDNLKFYKSILKKSEIDALTYQPFSIMAGDAYAKLGCLSCTYQEAVNSCKNEYHLCSFSEMYAGAYQVARIQGWMRLSMYFWTRVEQTQGQFFEELKDPNVNKVGICCINKGY